MPQSVGTFRMVESLSVCRQRIRLSNAPLRLAFLFPLFHMKKDLSKRYGCRKPHGGQCTKHQSMYSLQNSSKYITDFTKVNTSKIFKEHERAETSYKKLEGKNHVRLFNLRRQLTGNCEKILLPL